MDFQPQPYLPRIVVSTSGRVYSCRIRTRKVHQIIECTWEEKTIRDKPLVEKACLCPSPDGVFLIGGRVERNNCLRSNRFIPTGTEALSRENHSKQPLHAARDLRSAAICYENDFILVAGGDADGTSEIFSSCVGQWMRMLHPLPAPRFCHQLVCCASQDRSKSIYCIGGFDDNNKPLRSVLKLDFGDKVLKTPDQKASAVLKADWSTVSAMKQARHSFAAVAYRGRLVVVGGDNGTSPTNEIEIYNPDKNQWRKADHTLTRARKCHGCLVFTPECGGDDQDDYLVVLNGVDSGMRPIVEVEAISMKALFSEKSGETFRVIGSRQCKIGAEEYLASSTPDTLKTTHSPPPSTPSRLSRDESLHQGSEGGQGPSPTEPPRTTSAGTTSLLQKFRSKVWKYNKNSRVKHSSFSSRDTTATTTLGSEYEPGRNVVSINLASPNVSEDEELEEDNEKATSATGELDAEGDPYNWFLV